jgi:hypothetical protein
VVQVLQAIVLLSFLGYAWAREQRARREGGAA